MNKKNVLISTGIILLVVLSFLSGNTFAKYISNYKTSASLKIAKWSVTEDFLINGKSSTKEDFNLITTYDNSTLVNGKIAPGTSGKFQIEIDASGTETGVDYNVQFDKISDRKPENLVFTYNDKVYTLKELEEVLKGNIPANQENKVLNLEIGWVWAYETFEEIVTDNGTEQSSKSGDILDTEAGQEISNFGFDVIITCTQTIPKEIKNS